MKNRLKTTRLTWREGTAEVMAETPAAILTATVSV